jgi:hypothetical protein
MPFTAILSGLATYKALQRMAKGEMQGELRREWGVKGQPSRILCHSLTLLSTVHPLACPIMTLTHSHEDTGPSPEQSLPQVEPHLSWLLLLLRCMVCCCVLCVECLHVFGGQKGRKSSLGGREGKRIGRLACFI